MEIIYDKGKTNNFKKVNLLRKGKKGVYWLCGDKLGIFTNVITIVGLLM